MPVWDELEATDRVLVVYRLTNSPVRYLDVHFDEQLILFTELLKPFRWQS